MQTRKIVAVLLAVVMVLGLTATALAAAYVFGKKRIAR